MLKFLIFFTQLLLIFVPRTESYPNYEREGGKSLLRLPRQTKPLTDPYDIAFKKCVEYAQARYRQVIINRQLPMEKDRIENRLDCVKSQPLIYGGTPAIPKEFPHMAVIGYSKSDNIKYANWNCGGSLISNRYVLTAAHCLNDEAKWVRLGELVIDDETDSAQPKDFQISQFIQHPEYKSEIVYHDIALIKLNETVKFTPHIRPICLYTSPTITSHFHGKSLITGWGVPELGYQNSETLLKAKINFASDSECASAYKTDTKLPKGYNKSTMICAGDKVNGTDTCVGDSGGPLQGPFTNYTCMFWQVGVTSYGSFICGQKTKPAIYTKVYSYIPWIQKIVWP